MRRLIGFALSLTLLACSVEGGGHSLGSGTGEPVVQEKAVVLLALPVVYHVGPLLLGWAAVTVVYAVVTASGGYRIETPLLSSGPTRLPDLAGLFGVLSLPTLEFRPAGSVPDAIAMLEAQLRYGANAPQRRESGGPGGPMPPTSFGSGRGSSCHYASLNVRQALPSSPPSDVIPLLRDIRQLDAGFTAHSTDPLRLEQAVRHLCQAWWRHALGPLQASAPCATAPVELESVPETENCEPTITAEYSIFGSQQTYADGSWPHLATRQFQMYELYMEVGAPPPPF